MGKNIVLLGTAPSSLNLAPVASPDWEVWSCSPGTYHMPHIDRFFELHRWEPGQTWFSEGYCNFLRNFEGPVMMSQPIPEVKNAVQLPYKELVAKYSPYFFTSSLAWMMAMAIDEKPDKIALYGVDMAAVEEYKDQRLGCQFFALLAKSKGIEVGVPPESDLLRPAALYGVCENSHAWIKQTARSRELNYRLQEAKNMVEQKNAEIQFLHGAIDDQDWQLHSWFGSIDSLGVEYTEPPDAPVLKEIDGIDESASFTEDQWKMMSSWKDTPSSPYVTEEGDQFAGLPNALNPAVTGKKDGRPFKQIISNKFGSNGQTVCESCHSTINGLTDDNFNSDHTMIQCDSCSHWQSIL